MWCGESLGWWMKDRTIAGSGASVRKFVLLAAAAPVFWLAYNAIVYRNPLEFANGPYSAKAIERRTPGASHPGSHDLPVAFSYFLKSAEMNLAAGNWQKLWIVLALAGTIVCLIGGTGSYRRLHTEAGHLEQPADAGASGRCSCFGSRCRSMCFLSPIAECPFLCRSGGRFLITTFATDWNCCRHLQFFPPWRFTSWRTLARRRAVRLGMAVAALVFVRRKLRFNLAGSGLLSRSPGQLPHPHRPGARTCRLCESACRLIPPC